MAERAVVSGDARVEGAEGGGGDAECTLCEREKPRLLKAFEHPSGMKQTLLHGLFSTARGRARTVTAPSGPAGRGPARNSAERIPVLTA